MGFERIDDLLAGVTADGSLHGVAATVVGRDGVLYQGAAGDAKPDTMFRNASMTKAVATTAALQLVEQGGASTWTRPSRRSCRSSASSRCLTTSKAVSRSCGRPRRRRPSGI